MTSTDSNNDYTQQLDDIFAKAICKFKESYKTQERQATIDQATTIAKCIENGQGLIINYSGSLKEAVQKSLERQGCTIEIDECKCQYAIKLPNSL